MTPTSKELAKCLHDKHMTPETRTALSGYPTVPWRQIHWQSLLAEKCVDCERNIKHLLLLKI